jgi:hypothetical protein
VPEQFMGGFYGAADRSIGGAYHLLGHAEGWVTPDSRTSWAERRSRRLKDNSAANLQLNDLSQTFHQEQTSFLGLDAGHYGQGAWGAVESVAITGLTAPLVPAFTVANHARLTLALNSVAKVAPAAAIFGTRKGISTYDEAIAAGKTEGEALRLAWTSGVMEGAITAAFNAAGAGGIEGIASGSARELFRHTMRQSFTSAWLAGSKEFARGMLGEVGEEVLIEALDNAFVQMSLNPDMTIAEFFRKLHDTALVTAFTSAPSSAVQGVNAVRDVRGNNRAMEGEMGTSPTRQESVAPPQEDTRSDPEAGDIATAPADHDELSALEAEGPSKIDITAAGDYQNDADIPNHPRILEQTDLDPDSALHELKGTLNTTDGIAVVRLDMMRGTIKNPFKVIERLSAAARSQGATTLRIEATLANERLYDILRKRYKMTTEGSKDIINIPLE